MFWVTIVALLVAITSTGISITTLNRQKFFERSLRDERTKRKAIEQTVVDILDEDGNVRGQLALPGRVLHKDVANRLALAEKSVSTLEAETKKATADLKKAQEELAEAKAREDKIARTLAEVVDSDGTVLVQLRLPGEKRRPPNRTPCGEMCEKAFWSSTSESFRCQAGLGHLISDKLRRQFLDEDGQCVHFRLKQKKVGRS